MRRRAIRLVLALAWAASASGCSFLFSTVRGAVEGAEGASVLTENEHVRGSTSGRGSHRPLSCGSASTSPQRVHTFVAPRTAAYVFDSTTSDHDGVISVWDASGHELGCNDDHQSTRASEVTIALVEGQSVEVIQGGFGGASGSYELWVSGGAAIATAASTPQPLEVGIAVSGDTRLHAPIAGLDCPPASPMEEWTFTPPADGSFLFQVQADYDGYLAVVPEGSASAIGCNDDTGDVTQSQVVLELTASTRYRVIVGGYSGRSGTYTLTTTALSSGGALTLGQPVFFADGTTDAHSGGCGAPPGSLDRTFTFRPPADAFYLISTNAPGWLVIGDGRRTLACAAVGAEHRVGVALKPGHRYDIVIESGPGSSGAHYLSIERAAPDGPEWQGTMPPGTTSSDVSPL